MPSGVIGALKVLATIKDVSSFFLFSRPATLPFALEVEASPTSTNGADFSIVASY
ncbi:UNVERIFIED_CONTAM: hypothetical protein Slati_2257000 [Sesamum latifolium]|uniref:Uncharacterized protein n=1 Tax=Sesamum latifolium TaxID=2727402 RepID=A0AAW2WV74_9LAMI